MKTESSVAIMYAVSPCHAGSGSSLGAIDLPIQRERHTQWPMIASSGVKGAMRSHFEIMTGDHKSADSIFGASDASHAGAISVSDLKILAFPVRSNVAPFVWITCPSVLKRFIRDLRLAGKDNAERDLLFFNQLEKEKAWVWLWNKTKEIPSSILLEDIKVEKDELANNKILEEYSKFLNKAENLLIVHDSVFDYAVTQCTQVVAQIAINQKYGTTEDGSLRYQEELPSDTLMYCLVFWMDARIGENEKDKAVLNAQEIKHEIVEKGLFRFIQIGGDETLGRGYFEVSWI